MNAVVSVGINYLNELSTFILNPECKMDECEIHRIIKRLKYTLESVVPCYVDVCKVKNCPSPCSPPCPPPCIPECPPLCPPPCLPKCPPPC